MSLKVLELFGGIGACTAALKRLNIDFEVVDYVEIDKFAVRSYNAINNTNYEPQDIQKWDKDLEVDLVMHGSPDKDFSVAGLQKGGNEGSGTRSSLMYETLRIVEKLRPKYVIWENVKNVLSKKHRHNFDNYIQRLNELGYTSFYDVLNAKDFGIPQNRERVFVISVHGDYDFFLFPEPMELKLRLKDLLEETVNESYFLSEKQLKSLEYGAYASNKPSVKLKKTDTGIAPTLTTAQGGHRQPFVRINNVGKIKDWHQRGYVLGTDGICGTLAATDYKGPKLIEDPIFIKNATKRGRVGFQITHTLTTSATAGVVVYQRIRKLTPKEYWRLMGFDDEDFDKAAQVNSNTQLYKQAGNSIVVNVCVEILRGLLLP